LEGALVQESETETTRPLGGGERAGDGEDDDAAADDDDGGPCFRVKYLRFSLSRPQRALPSVSP